ncbi:MAG: hypothetical protein MJZ16_11095 [Bacteroidales bacterium]|nr:hypothetical protein [Bacteroidales bacterium]
MRKTSIIAVFAAAFMSCTPRASVPERFSSVTDTLSAGKHFAMVDLGGEDEALLVTDYVYDDLEGHIATINAHVYATDQNGNVVDCGEVFSQGTAYPLAVKDSCLFTAGHRFIQKYTLKYGNGKLEEAGNLLEELDSLGDPLRYVIDGDMVCLPGDSLVLATYDEWNSADVLSFSPIR